VLVLSMDDEEQRRERVMNDQFDIEPSTPTAAHDRGFTLVEMLIVIVILGVLATVTLFAVRGISDRGEDSACSSDVRIISQAAEVYMADRGVDALPATGSGDDRYEQTIIDAGFLVKISTYYDLNADGTVTTNGVPCV
jgi:prepilin-type N-terminal cleavage/methylation domain-containing protein